ncbi:carotenoid oxygenase family protein [Salinirubellus salinus]|uniref:Carotenoid oxygenase family protein n=1 Tax=Salinirubellus salinus TaxID=1364945 RepID=A0A9E7U5W3_9EURY|nr:carotenoid oxygenase family protein [Salinirubellus salinus]UWM55845.1 carotenoid oxygenase family protein [Salinirubellus salinus]
MATDHAGTRLGFHSIDEELDTELAVEGEVPGWLSGALIRNGPGSFDLADGAVGHWFDGLAMLRKFTFEDGRVRYRNRFLRTEAYADAERGEYRGGFGTDGSLSRLEKAAALLTPPSPTDNTNIDVWRFGGEYAALTETEHLTLFDPETLETTGLTTYLGEPYGQHVTGHPHHDDERGVTVGLSTYFGRQPEYRLWRQHDGRWSRESLATLPADEPAYLHSFALTDRYAVVVEFPLVVSPLRLLRPSNEAFIKRFDWDPERGTRYRVVDRETGVEVASPVGESFFCFHHVNTYDDGEELVLDMVTFPDAAAITELYFDGVGGPSSWELEGGRLTRARLDPRAGTVETHEVHGGHLGLPRVSPAVTASEYRYAYAQGDPGQPVTGLPESVLKVDVETGEDQWYDAGGYTSEAVFVPRPDGDREDDGVVLAVVLDADTERSELHVVDGASMTRLAVAPLPHALPLDFHGQFLPEVR